MNRPITPLAVGVAYTWALAVGYILGTRLVDLLIGVRW